MQDENEETGHKEGQAGHDTYLLCPLRDDQVEAIRAEAYKVREDTFPHEAWKARGNPSSDELLSWLYARKQLYWPLSQQQMQAVVARYYGWDEWKEDPWGNSASFLEWMFSVQDNEVAVWAVNETLGRVYLAIHVLEQAGKLDFPNMTDEDLLTDVGAGAAGLLLVKRHTGWEFEDFLHHYPYEPLPAGLVNERVSKVYPFDLKLPRLTVKSDGTFDVHQEEDEGPFEKIEDLLYLFLPNYGPFTRYIVLISSIYLWHFAIWEVVKRFIKCPEHPAVLDYITATNANIGDIYQRIAPKRYRHPNQSGAFAELEQVMKTRLQRMAAKYGDVFDSWWIPKEDGALQRLKPSYVEAQQALFHSLNEKASEPYEAVVKGLRGGLSSSLLAMIKHDLIDATRKEMKFQKRKVVESKPEARGLTDDDTSFLDTIPSSETVPEEPIDLSSLGIDLDRLKPKERWVLSDVLQGFAEGYSFDSKKGLSFSQRWGKDYAKNIKAYNRAKARLNQS